ncbi:DUF3164 family protein [Marinomonas sp. THO17]|uniref:DUF3164 family protein n=1 Tax=Marinomonas sp. THO17 TaxID=3149048 RepID=UPI00336C281F
MWVSAKECAGVNGFPTDVSNVRARLELLSTEATKRKREGTKAFEYHISILPVAAQAALYKRAGKLQVGDKVLDIPTGKAKSDRYCREALWSRWNNAGNKAQAKAKAKLSYLTVLSQLINSGVPKMQAYESVCEEFGVAFASVRREFSSLKNFDEADWLPVLLPKNKEAATSIRKNRFAYITPEAWDFIKSDYLRQEEPTFTTATSNGRATMSINQQQETFIKVPEGMRVNAEGHFVPENMIRPIDQARDSFVNELIGKVKVLHEEMADFKACAFGDIAAFVEMSAEEYGVKLGGKQGNITLYSFDGRYKVQRSVNKKMAFDERLQAAKALIDEYLSDLSEGAKPELKLFVNDFFNVDGNGEIQTDRVRGLRLFAITDERWIKALAIISDAYIAVGSKSYVRFYERVGDTDQFKPISLDIASL